jgi:GNAT superfamily N-acetyltransferase
MSLTPIRDGELAAVVTHLEMRLPRGEAPPSSPLKLQRVHPSLDAYRALFRQVGARWLWFSRLIMAGTELSAIIDDPNVEIFAVEDAAGDEAGLVELDFREAGACELSFIGLVPRLTGSGHGRWLLSEALVHAWRSGVTRVHVHTCSLDHPAALAAYRRAGFIFVRRAIECFPDPRLLGILPLDCAPQIPLLGAGAEPSAAPASWA